MEKKRSINNSFKLSFIFFITILFIDLVNPNLKFSLAVLEYINEGGIINPIIVTIIGLLGATYCYLFKKGRRNELLKLISFKFLCSMPIIYIFLCSALFQILLSYPEPNLRLQIILLLAIAIPSLIIMEVLIDKFSKFTKIV
ncbi:hypothetical protein [Acinetobacter sp. YH1901134]|uniref:hypothetical protein n=1 Tax=Acinetobacter sp. YH1901134 TaxID=2601199 RepID=UPI0015D41AB4|nr:hypothetical protein [Acinetobacter sp. YH1901134]